MHFVYNMSIRSHSKNVQQLLRLYEWYIALSYLKRCSRLQNRRRAGNKRRAWTIWQKFEIHCNEKTRFKLFFRLFFLNLTNVGSFNKAVVHEKKSEINKRLFRRLE